MATITVPYEFMPKEPYEITGDTRSGLKATCSFLLAWADAIIFVNEVLVAPAAVRYGLITWNTPLQFPVAIGNNLTPAIYVQAFRIRPMGAPIPSANYVPGPVPGLTPGDFYTRAIVTLSFETVTYINQSSDDPYNLNQLDPTNPITACEQSVEMRAKMRSTKGKGWAYKTSGKPVPGDFPVPETEAVLVLDFPRIPYLPWFYVAPYMGAVNMYPMLGAATGALILDGMGTKTSPQPDGSIQQNARLTFCCNLPGGAAAGTSPGGAGTDWNMQPLDDGSGNWDYIVAKNNTSVTPIRYADFRQIFNSISF